MLRKGESVRRRVTGSILEMPTIFKKAHCATDLYTDVFGHKEGTMWCSGARDTMQEQSGETQCRTLPGRRTVRRWGCKCWARRRGQKKGQILEGFGRATRVAKTFEKNSDNIIKPQAKNIEFDILVLSVQVLGDCFIVSTSKSEPRLRNRDWYTYFSSKSTIALRSWIGPPGKNIEFSKRIRPQLLGSR